MKLTRRKVLIGTGVTGGALILGFAYWPDTRMRKASDLTAEADERLVTSWVKVARDNRITAIIPHAEMGQGTHTALTMMLAEEMDADWDLVSMMEAPADDAFANGPLIKGFAGEFVAIPSILLGVADYPALKLAQFMNIQMTGGSSAIRYTGTAAMRPAGAAAREMFSTAAANNWQVPAAECRTEKSMVHHGPSGRSVTYGSLIDEVANIEPPKEPRLKDPSTYTIVGTPAPRFDIPAKVDGTTTYGIDVKVPGMRYAAIKASPVFGGEVVSFDASAIKSMPGVEAVVEIPNAVAVIADSYWRAQKAVDALPIVFQGGTSVGLDNATMYRQFDEALDTGSRENDREQGDVDAAFAQADQVVEVSYSVPLLAHATMEPMNCTAVVRADGTCEVWTGTQNPLGARGAAAEAAGLNENSVTVHNHMLGGGFGRRSDNDFVIQAVEIAKQVSYPVKLIWSREEDMQHDHYRAAVTSRFKGAFDASGQPIAWQNLYNGKDQPGEAPLIHYGIPNQRIEYVEKRAPVPHGPWRSVAHSQHGYFTESFIDEMAHAAGADGFTFRRKLLADSPRHLRVLETAAEKAEWDAQLPEGWGRGIAMQHAFGTIVAQVVEASVSPQGDVKVHRVIAAVDSGDVINPDTVDAQIQSGIIYGLTAALYGEITIADGRVVQSNFPDYEMVRLAQAPHMETHIIRSGEPLGGMGEPGTPPIAPALANAIFDATGKRLRSLPVKNHDLTPDGPRIGSLIR